jgi:hypothetical protein
MGRDKASKRKSESTMATDVRFEGDVLCITLIDACEIRVPLDKAPELSWLARATPEQRANWSLEPRGFAVYWEDLDDGIEICHLLSMQAIN